MEKPETFKVTYWHDCQGIPTFFLVEDESGYRYGVFPSEAQAIAVAAFETAWADAEEHRRAENLRLAVEAAALEAAE
jgi:hypothetical protein